MKARCLTTMVCSAALFASGCATTATVASAAPPIDDTINTEAVFPDDGLSHVIVTPIVGLPEDDVGSGAAAPASAASVETPGGDEPLDPSDFLTPEMVADVPPGVPLGVRDGEIGYVDENGQFVPLTVPVPTTTVTTEAVAPDPPASDLVEVAMSYGNPFIDQLAADPAVVGITVIGDGTFGVSVSDLSVIDPQIFAIVPDVPFGVTVDQYEGFQWALENDGTSLQTVTAIEQVDDADLDVASTLERADGSGVVVAVIDSGVDFAHGDLTNSAWSNLGEVCGNGTDDDGNGYVDDCTGWDFANNDPAPFNEGADSHGTHVSGIITANRDGRGIAGIAPDVRVMDLNVAKRTTSGDSITGASVTAAIRYAVDNGADIINLSLGSQPGTSAASVAPMGAAIDYAASNGVVVVVAAGNHGIDLASLPVYPASFNRPNMIVVGASSPSDTRASFSNYGAGIVDVYAPGELILSTVPGDDFRFMSGTSQASPAVAATVALVMQTVPEATVAEVIDTVVSSVDRSDGLSTSVSSGRVNTASAIGADGAAPIPTELEVRVSGISGPSNAVNATVEIVTPPAVFDEDYRWELSLVHTNDNGAYAIVDHPFLIDGEVVVTSAIGAVELAAADATSVAVGTTLPAGRYSFIIEAVALADSEFRLGDAFVTTFEIPGDPETPVDTTPPTTAPLPAPSADEVDDGSATTLPRTASDGGGTGSGGTDESGDSSDGGAASPSTTVRASDAPASTDAATSPKPVGDDASSSGSTGPSSGTVDADGGSTGSDPGSSEPTSPSSSTESSPGTTSPSESEPVPSNAIPKTPAPVPDGLGSGTAQKGEWEATSVSPQAGYVTVANTVVIRGTFPSDTYVWFGDQPGQVVHQNRSEITVRTPLRAAAGVVDITLQKSPTGVVLRIPDAYAFVSLDDAMPDADSGTNSGTTDSGAATSPGSGSNDSGSNDAGAPDSGSTDSGGESGTDGGDPESGIDVSDRRARMTVGAAVDLPNGLRGGSVIMNPASGTTVCSTDPCVSVRR